MRIQGRRDGARWGTRPRRPIVRVAHRWPTEPGRVDHGGPALGASRPRAVGGLLHSLDVGSRNRLAWQSGVEGVGRRQQVRPIDLPQPPSHQLLGGGAGRHDPGRLGDGLIASLAGVVLVDEVGHTAKQPGQRADLVVGHLPSSSTLADHRRGGCSDPPRLVGYLQVVAAFL
jgi:hypothetical protein